MLTEYEDKTCFLNATIDFLIGVIYRSEEVVGFVDIVFLSQVDTKSG